MRLDALVGRSFPTRARGHRRRALCAFGALGTSGTFGFFDIFNEVALDEPLDGSIIGTQSKHSPNCGGNEQVALDVAQAPNKEFEPTIGLGRGRIRAVMVSIEHDESRVARFDASPLLEIGDRTGGPPTTEDDGIALDTSCEPGVDPSSPTFENLAIPRALDVEHKRA